MIEITISRLIQQSILCRMWISFYAPPSPLCMKFYLVTFLMIPLLSLPVTVLFLAFGCVILVHALKNRKREEKKPHFTNEVLLALLFFAGGLMYPFTYVAQGISVATAERLHLVTMIIIFAEMILWASMLAKGRVACQDKTVFESRDYEKFKADYCANYEYTFRADLRRKALHLLPVGVILLFWVMGLVLDHLGWLPVGLTQAAFSYWLIITIGFAFILMFATADLSRVSGRGHYLPSWAMKWFCGSMKTDELDTFVSSESMVLSFIPFVFFPFPVFASVALITALADAAASLVGKKFGKRKIFSSSEKTVEGYFAGGFATFSCVVVMASLFMTPEMTVVTIFMMALFATIFFIAVDALSRKVSDNILNPLLCGAAMVLAITFF